MKKIIFLILISVLLQFSSTLKLTLQLLRNQKQCFYKSLEFQRKYLIEVTPLNKIKYQVLVNNMEDNEWKSVYYKSTVQPFENIQIHKLASSSSTYSICFRNIENDILRIQVKIQSGLSLMQFQLLPDKNDAENLERELTWLENQKQKLKQNVIRMDGIKATTEELVNLMSFKMIGFAIIGILSILVINFIFHRELKKILKDRKII